MLWLPTESELPWGGPEGQQQQLSPQHFYPQPIMPHGRALRKAKADSAAAVDQEQQGGGEATASAQPSPPRGKDDKGKAPLFPSHHPASS